jgi:hypothetical protein
MISGYSPRNKGVSRSEILFQVYEMLNESMMEARDAWGSVLSGLFVDVESERGAKWRDETSLKVAYRGFQSSSRHAHSIHCLFSLPWRGASLHIL